MDLFLVAALSATDDCGGLLPIIKIVVSVIKIFMIIIPILLILFGTIDLGKAVIASDEKEVKAAQGRLIKRFIYAALVFFVPLLVGVVMSLIAAGDTDDASQNGDTGSWKTCWQAANK